MFKIEVINKFGQSFYNEKETRAELEEWIAKEKINKSFGKTAGIYNESQLSQEELVGSVEIIPGENEIHNEKMYQIQDQFTYVITDITTEHNKQKKIDKKKKVKQTIWDLLDVISDINDSLNDNQLDALFSSAEYQKLLAAILSGESRLTKKYLNSYGKTIWTNKQVKDMVDLIQGAEA